jgi:hypothetical protein
MPTPLRFLMTLTIEIDRSLEDLSARMRKSTFAAIPAIAKAKLPVESQVAMGVLFEKAYMLTLVDDERANANTLYVSPGVKKLFYADKTALAL